MWARKILMKDTGCETWAEVQKKYGYGIDQDILPLTPVLNKVPKSHLNKPKERPSQYRDYLHNLKTAVI